MPMLIVWEVAGSVEGRVFRYMAGATLSGAEDLKGQGTLQIGRGGG